MYIRSVWVELLNLLFGHLAGHFEYRKSKYPLEAI
jgi:hypothetical protein